VSHDHAQVGEAEGKYLEELAKQINCQAIGHRLLRGLVSPGGLRREPQLNGLADVLKRLRGEFTHYAAMLEASTTHLDRLITTGMLSRKLAFDQGATGPVERASGLDRDLRRDQPYAAYPELPLKVAVREAGDAHARQQIRIAEIENSIELIQVLLERLPGGLLALDANRLPAAKASGGRSRRAAHFTTRCILTAAAALRGGDQVAQLFQLACGSHLRYTTAI